MPVTRVAANPDRAKPLGEDADPIQKELADRQAEIRRLVAPKELALPGRASLAKAESLLSLRLRELRLAPTPIQAKVALRFVTLAREEVDRLRLIIEPGRRHAIL